MSAQRLVLTAHGSARARIHCQRGLALHRSAALCSALFRSALFYFLLVSIGLVHVMAHNHTLSSEPRVC